MAGIKTCHSPTTFGGYVTSFTFFKICLWTSFYEDLKRKKKCPISTFSRNLASKMDSQNVAEFFLGTLFTKSCAWNERAFLLIRILSKILIMAFFPYTIWPLAHCDVVNIYCWMHFFIADHVNFKLSNYEMSHFKNKIRCDFCHNCNFNLYFRRFALLCLSRSCVKKTLIYSMLI